MFYQILVQSFYILVFLLSFSLSEKSSSHLYEIKSSQHKQWKLFDITCSPNITTTTRDDGGPVSRRAIDSSSKPVGSLKETQDSKFEGKESAFNNPIPPISKAIRTLEIKKLVNGNEPINKSVYKTNEVSSDEIVNGNSSVPVVITNVNFNSTNHAKFNIKCDSIFFGNNTFSDHLEKLIFMSEGTIELNIGWLENIKKLHSLKIFSESSLTFPSNCSWLPETVRSLDLSYSPMKELLLNTDCVHSLEELLISSASLSSFSMCLPFLKELDASWNALVGPGIHLTCKDQSANSTKILKLSNNQLSSWSSCGWPSLIELYLHNNNIVMLNITSCPMKNLEILDLSNNWLQNAPAKYPHKLTKVDLSHNHLKTTTPFNHFFKEIDLSHNWLTTIARGTFRSSWQLVSLDLSHNKLTVIHGHDFKGLHEVKNLDLSHNSLRSVRYEAFRPLKRIQTLSLTNNALHELDSRLFSNLPPTLNFESYDNPWTCSCHLMSSLKKLNHCHECSNQRELFCREGNTKVTAKSVLQGCIKALQGLSNSTVHLRKDHASDEDTSEEVLDSSHPVNYVMIAVTTGVIILVIPLLILGSKKIYKKRKVIRRMCICYGQPDHSPIDNSANGKWSSANGFNMDSDSETEF